MASNKPNDSVRLYTTDTVVDNPGAEIAFKGVICEEVVDCRSEYGPDFQRWLELSVQAF